LKGRGEKWAWLMRAWEQIRDGGAVLLYPEECRVCGGRVEGWAEGIACRACWKSIEALRATWPVCDRCGEWFSPGQSLGAGCAGCPLEGEKGLVVARSVGPHQGALRESVLWLKRHPGLAQRAGDLLLATWKDLPGRAEIEAILPVPLHAEREKERGFNQAEVIARWLGREVGLPVEMTSLLRQRSTERHRFGMGRKERLRSLKGAFRVRTPRLIEGRSLLVVDDVMTTGTTALAVGTTLCDAGATSVRLLTLTRALGRPTR
jgi:ComF family protein